MTQIQDCWEGDNTVSLPDLATEDANVRSMWQSWITQLVANYTIDGLRMDSCFELDYAFFEPFQASANVYIVGEVDNGNPAIVCPYQKDYGLNTLNYPAYYWITQAFQSTSGSISNLAAGINTMKSECSDTTLLGSFMENHDNPRFPSYTSDISLAKNAIAFTMLADGIPIIYEGQEQHLNGGGVPDNREAVWLSGYNTSATLYSQIKSLNQIRSEAIKQSSAYVTSQADVTYSDNSTIVTRKGSAGFQIVGVFSNRGANGSGGGTGPTTTSTSPTSCTAIPVKFDETVTTTFGQTIKISGDISALGNWDTANAIALSAADYTSSDPLWFVTLELTPGQVVEYKYINVAENGAVTWEADPNHTYTVPMACTATPTITNTWQT
ncbi:acid alpha-amylase [Trichoderma asperellum]|uniref:alpha-amylase n=1 Tax=Trichoderma asperellum TaxID=101201 RepID=A0A6V8R5G2_TRIAP|nr:acid alpha-amylase [Trichoderma asperellum]